MYPVYNAVVWVVVVDFDERHADYVVVVVVAGIVVVVVDAGVAMNVGAVLAVGVVMDVGEKPSFVPSIDKYDD